MWNAIKISLVATAAMFLGFAAMTVCVWILRWLLVALEWFVSTLAGELPWPS